MARSANFHDLERDLAKIPGVTSARVVGEGEPSEIHILATEERPAKQVVRDVQSLIAAGFGMSIDHRIVSVVQLEEPSAQPDDSRRPQLERVVQASKGDEGWVKVALRWPDGRITEGAGATGASRDTRARGAVIALLGALEEMLQRAGARVHLEHMVIQAMGSADSIVLRAAWSEGGTIATLVGSALIEDDVATAAVRALLQALNRKLRPL